MPQGAEEEEAQNSRCKTVVFVRIPVFNPCKNAQKNLQSRYLWEVTFGLWTLEMVTCLSRE